MIYAYVIAEHLCQIILLNNVVQLLPRVTRRVPLVEQDTAYPSGTTAFTPGFCGIGVAQYLVFIVVFCPFSFDHFIVYPSLIYGF